jgi:hypothetical protein
MVCLLSQHSPRLSLSNPDPVTLLPTAFAPVPQELVDKLDTHEVWRPLKGSQELALCCPANEILYSGTRGPGKTDAQIMDFRKMVGQGYGQFWKGIIFDRQYKNLDDVISKTKRWFPKFQDGARFIGSGALKWVWPTGEELLFRHCKTDSDYNNYHGHEYPWIAWNELTKYPTSSMYDAMMSCNRTSFVPHLHSPGLSRDDIKVVVQCIDSCWPLDDIVGTARAKTIVDKILPPLPLRVFSTTNPYGAGHNWVKRRFVQADPELGDTRGRIVRRSRMIFSPRTQKRELITKTQCHISGTWRENTFLPSDYPMTLTEIKDPNKRKAWLKGDWDIVAGGALDDVWSPRHQIKPRFKVPPAWRLSRSFDWGSTHPFWCGWWATANGEECVIKHPDGTEETFCPAKGSLILWHEWYGVNTDQYGQLDLGTNEGLKLSSRKVAVGIKSRESGLKGHWHSGEVVPGPADNQISNVNDEESQSIESIMAKEGVRWTRSDKSAGSRKNGLELVRQALENSITGDGPGLYFMDHCAGAIGTLPSLPRDEDDMDDVDTDAEDHPYDGVRYMCLAHLKDLVKVSPVEM